MPTPVLPRLLLGVAGLGAVAVAYLAAGGRLAVRQIEDESPIARARREMVERQLRSRDVRDPRVLEVMGRVPRHLFVAQGFRDEAYDDHPLPIGHGQTISQPYIVGLMTQLVRPKPGDRALDVGTGSGYQAAILCELCKEVYSIEIIKPLADEAAKRLADLGYKNVTVRAGDGYRGWPEHAPFDVIVVAASPREIPQPLLDQLAPGGRLVLPVGGYPQDLTLVEKLKDGTIRRRTVAPVLFVPMTGEAEAAGKP
jgi:protein-L-isoaspartate(D-aspartate) O-methyltransferase